MSQIRQLAAIMFTDIEGYTALMQQDEKEAVVFRNRHRNTFERTTEAFNGKIIQYFGDGTLSTFKSTVEAVECAIEMQNAFLEEPKIPVRIGIHVGDIIQLKDDIIGDAVNVASRIESCAIPGSILISDKVHDQIRSHRHIESAFLDAYDLKNVDEAMPIFAISNEGLAVPNPEDVQGELKSNPLKNSKIISKKRAISLSILAFILIVGTVFSIQYFSNQNERPEDLSIAVLPFNNLSADNDAEIFRDGVTEDILTQLSKLKQLHVISRKSVMQFKNLDKPISQIAKKLRVSYILQGSIRKYDDKVRVTAQLVVAETDELIWAGQYDKTLTDIFAIQSEVSKEIVDALNLNITFDEQQSLEDISTHNIEAYKLFLRGRQEADKRTQGSIAASIKLYEAAIDLDNNYAEAYAEIANSVYLETYYSGRDAVEASKLANDYLNKAEKISIKVSRIYSVRGLIYNIEGKHELAKAAFEKAIKLAPNDLTARHQFSTFYYYTQQYEKQLEQAKIAYTLDPLSFATANSYFTALTANFKYDEAEKLMQSIEKESDGSNAFVINRSYFRLYIDKRDYKMAIVPLKKIVDEQPVFNRFLGYCYGKEGDTINCYKVINTIKSATFKRNEKNHQIAIAFAGLQETDSVLYYLDTIRNNQRTMLQRERYEFFGYLKDDPRFIDLIKAHALEVE
ncbi:hypothetical protein A9Q87_12715 [Flavobacteriales bacterium 34_180_T64]|nr:hypothetical protein A9Q87_12715 [Flavobacteriales bacterium 34_180_T64]